MKLTPKQYLKQYPAQYVMVTYEFGEPMFIVSLKNLQIQIALSKNETELWSVPRRHPKR